MASIVGIGIYAGTVRILPLLTLPSQFVLCLHKWQVFIVTLGIFTYIPMSYPPYAASLFASNDVCRSLMAFGAVLYGRPLYENLGIGPGSSLLAGLSFLGVVSVPCWE
jgi:MFS transporter, DHA1 family, multidrug resistance protein